MAPTAMARSRQMMFGGVPDVLLKLPPGVPPADVTVSELPPETAPDKHFKPAGYGRSHVPPFGANAAIEIGGQRLTGWATSVYWDRPIALASRMG